MCNKGFIFLIFMMICLLSHPFQFQLLNSEVVYGRSMAALYIKIEDPIVSFNISSKKLCLIVNGVACYCFDETLDNVSPYFHKNCINNNSLWLSICIMDENMKMIPSHNAYHFPSIDYSTTTTSLEAYDNFLNDQSQLVTLILPVTVNDLSRMIILMESLLYIPRNTVLEMLIVSPDPQIQIFQRTLQAYQISPLRLSFKLRFLPESRLFPESYWKSKRHVYPYALQMAIKLLVAQEVQTDFYITLDADLILLKSWRVDDVIRNGRAVYEHEHRLSVHPLWWEGSERVLQLQVTQPDLQGFGVTPAVLSTHGALLVSVVGSDHSHYPLCRFLCRPLAESAVYTAALQRRSECGWTSSARVRQQPVTQGTRQLLPGPVSGSGASTPCTESPSTTTGYLGPCTCPSHTTLLDCIATTSGSIVNYLGIVQPRRPPTITVSFQLCSRRLLSPSVRSSRNSNITWLRPQGCRGGRLLARTVWTATADVSAGS